MAKTAEVAFRAASYARLSRDDDNLGESNSITNQRNIIADWAAEHPDVQVVQDFCDDGFSGSNFERPGFQEMMDAVAAGNVNCIVVKDLSRFGRNYLQVGYYLERLLPQLGVRIIAIADGYDSNASRGYEDSLMLPFKNLMNDVYCRDVSMKIKTQLTAKRKRGECVSPSLPYGFMKDKAEKGKVLVDQEAARVVADIFNMRLKGMSAEAIAAKLDEDGIASPYAHMRSLGLCPSANFKRGEDRWNARGIMRILQNEMYTGTMVQGKTQKPDFRSKAVVAKDPECWVRVDNAIEPIVDLRTFDLVQDLAARDTRSAPGAAGLSLFSGFVYCADCGSTMARRTVKSKGREYIYYTCMGNRADKRSCSTHNISEPKLMQAVQTTLFERVQTTLDGSDLEARVKAASNLAKILKGLEDQERSLVARVERIGSLKRRLYEDYADDVLTRAEFQEFSKSYDEEAARQRRALAKIAERVGELKRGPADEYLKAVARHRDAGKIDRLMLMELVDRIEVHERGVVEIRFRFDELGARAMRDANDIKGGAA